MSSQPQTKVRVGVNGFGRIGRLATRLLLDSDVCEITHINELNTDAEGAAYLLQFDSIHGQLGREVSADADSLTVAGGARISVSRHATPSAVDWAGAGVELVLECSGKFNDLAKLDAEYPPGGRVRRVLVSAPVKGAANVVLGCNEAEIAPETRVATAASCTTNCIAPVIKVLDAAFGIERGFINTVHNITNTQSTMDAPNTKKSDPRRARAGMLNLAPTTTGSAKAVTMIFPHLAGKLDGLAIRVPLQNASITDLTLQLRDTEVVAADVNAALEAAVASDEGLAAVLGVERRQLVSTDFVNDQRSSIVDAASTQALKGGMVKVLAWYDNEFGYSARMRDLAELMARQMQASL